MSRIPVEPFAWWIFGYQKFSESVIRACICRDKGWQDITGKVQTKVPTEIGRAAEARKDWGGNLEPLRVQARNRLGARSKRLALDAVFLDDRTGRICIGEFKSWGGFQLYDPKVLAEELRQGKWFPDRLAIRGVEDRQNPAKEHVVSGFVFATNLKGCESGSHEFMLGQLHVEILDIRSLLRKNAERPPEGMADLFADLDAAVEKVKTYVRKGEPPSSPSPKHRSDQHAAGMLGRAPT